MSWCVMALNELDLSKLKLTTSSHFIFNKAEFAVCYKGACSDTRYLEFESYQQHSHHQNNYDANFVEKPIFLIVPACH